MGTKNLGKKNEKSFFFSKKVAWSHNFYPFFWDSPSFPSWKTVSGSKLWSRNKEVFVMFSRLFFSPEAKSSLLVAVKAKSTIWQMSLAVLLKEMKKRTDAPRL